MFTRKIQSIDELQNIANEMITHFIDDRIFAFHGKMGVGKTTFIQALCKALSSDDIVTSPTFAIVNEYHTQQGTPIFHFDFYRIEDIEEAYDLGYEEYIYSNHYCFIEWPEMIEQLLPESFVEVTIKEDKDQNRIISAQKYN